MDFESFLSVPKLRQHVVPIDKIGDLILTELSGKEAADRFRQAESLEGKGMEENHDHMRWWACRMLKGSNPVKAEVEKVKSGYSMDVIIEIYQQGLNYTAATSEAKEQIEKN